MLHSSNEQNLRFNRIDGLERVTLKPSLGFNPSSDEVERSNCISGAECGQAAVLSSEYQVLYAILTFSWIIRSVPTKNDILVPETVLKKRKSQEKERELKAAELKKKREVSFHTFGRC
jgi:hypothetical protein